MKWPLIVDRSCLLQQGRQGENSSSTPGDEEIQDWNYLRCDTNAALNTTSPDSTLCLPIPNQIIFILSISVIVLGVSEIKSRELGDFNHGFNVLNIECESRKNGLTNNKYGFDCGALASHTIGRIGAVPDTTAPRFKFDPMGVGLTEFDSSECDLTGVLSARVTTITNENKNKMKHENGSNGPVTNTQTAAQTLTQHPTAPVIDRNDRMCVIGKQPRKFDNIGCIFNGNIDRNGLRYDMLSADKPFHFDPNGAGPDELSDLEYIFDGILSEDGDTNNVCKYWCNETGNYDSNTYYESHDIISKWIRKEAFTRKYQETIERFIIL